MRDEEGEGRVGGANSLLLETRRERVVVEEGGKGRVKATEGGGGEGGERARSQDREGAAEEELKEREKRETRGREEGQGRDCDTRATRHEL